MSDYSSSPAGDKYPLPKPEEYQAEFDRIKTLTEHARTEGKEIVVVMGLGFVGAVMAG
ncbi:MAG: GDP-mannose dehydrogenase, partial [Planctomycetes bacterium]|nr:GDP-mannose dehydrogenase [Planctomycetota bacterium]